MTHPRLICTFFGLFLLATAGARTAGAADILVPSQVPTIQQAIDLALDGDTVFVAPGTYTERIDFLGKAITVTSEAGPEVTILDGGELGSVVTFASGEGQSSVLSGFMVRNGRANFGAGIKIGNAANPSPDSSPRIVGNDIVGNRGCGGIGIGVDRGSPVIEDNTIRLNRQSGCSNGDGGGIGVLGALSRPLILGNTITENSISKGHGGGISAEGEPEIRNNIITDNQASGGSLYFGDIVDGLYQGGGLYLRDTTAATVVQNIFARNSAIDGGALAFQVPAGSSGLVIANNTMLSNWAIGEDLVSGMPGNGTHADAVSARGSLGQTRLTNNILDGRVAIRCAGDINVDLPPVIEFNDVIVDDSTGTYNGWGGICVDQTGISGNISADPLLAAISGEFYSPPQGSPVIDAGTNTPPQTTGGDIEGRARVVDGNGDGSAVTDMGAFEFQNRLIVKAGPDRAVRNDETVYLNGYGTLSADGRFPNGSQTVWTLEGAEIATQGAAQVGPFAAGSYTVTLTVTTPGGDSASDSFVLTVVERPLNGPPLADAGGDQTVADFDAPMLVGRSFDADGPDLAYRWELDGVVLPSPYLDPLPVGTYSITLTVTDPQGASDSDTATLTVVPTP